MFLAIVESSEDPIPAKNMRCERICRSECKTNFTSLFVVEKEDENRYEGLTNAPDEDCYDKYDTEKDEEACKKALKQAEISKVIPPCTWRNLYIP